jgi:single-strand DNA-binding protein
MLNKVILVGNLGKNPEKHSLPSGSSYVSFPLATAESYKDKEGEWKKETTWHNIIIWRDLGERAFQSLKKGYLIYLEGKVTNRSWTDEGGQQNYITEIVVSTFRLLKQTGEEMEISDRKEPQQPKENFTQKKDVLDDFSKEDGDLPF